jgi:hypothetical protein
VIEYGDEPITRKREDYDIYTQPRQEWQATWEAASEAVDVD